MYGCSQFPDILDIQGNGPPARVPSDDCIGFVYILIGQHHAQAVLFEQVANYRPGDKAGTEDKYLFHFLLQESFLLNRHQWLLVFLAHTAIY